MGLDSQIDSIRDCIEKSLAEYLKTTVEELHEIHSYSSMINYYIKSLRDIRYTINPERRLALYREKIFPLIEKTNNGLGTLGQDFNGGKMRRFAFGPLQKQILQQCLNELERIQTELNKTPPVVAKESTPGSTENVELPILTTLPVIVDLPIVERNIDENGHPIMNANMFQRYVKARIEAARALNGDKEKLDDIASKVDNLFHDDDFVAFKQAKRHKDEMIKKATRWFKEGEIDSPTFQSTCLEAERLYKTDFDRAYNANIIKVKQVSRLLADAVDPKEDPVKVIKAISKKADDLRALEARPILRHHYHAKGLVVSSSHVPEGWLTKEQQVLYRQVNSSNPPTHRPYTCPSTIRDKRQVGQVNALRTEVAINGVKTFVGHRHGSPSVLHINNDAERQYRTLQNIKQTLTTAAQDKIAQFGSSDNVPDPLIVEMTSMSLLSPVMKGDLFDSMKQYRQVDDSRNAYWSLHGRAIPLEVIGADGKTRTINVQLDSTFMSIGVNAVRGAGTLAARELVQRVNNRGLDHLINHFLKKTDSIEPQIKRLVNRLKEIESMPLIKEAKASIAQFNRQELNDAYEKLEYCNRALSDPDHKAIVDSKVIKKERKAVLKIIDNEEKKLDKFYRKLAKAREGIYQERISDLKNILVEMKATNNYQGNKDFQKFQIFVDAIDIYYNQPQPGLKRFIAVKMKTHERNIILKKMVKEDSWDKKDILREQANMLQSEIDALNKSNYRFQARFAMLANYMEQFIEWFCKSGEDRTGLLNEHIEAFCIFIEKYGYAPSWDNKEDHVKFHKLMPLVHNGAPNRETNGYNDDCPGMKVSDPDFEMPTVSYYTDKKVANISKIATSIAPSLGEKIKQFFSNLIGTGTIPKSVRQAQAQIERIANTRQPVYEVLGPIENFNVQNKTVDNELPLQRVNTYIPGVDKSAQKSEKRLNNEKASPKKGQRKSTKL